MFEGTDSVLVHDCMKKRGIFKTMKRQWNILITGSSLDGMENSEIFKTMNEKTMEHSDHWIITGWHGEQ